MAERFRHLNKTDPTTPDPDLVEFACLAHDLGHPPFGHAGELALQAALQNRLRAGLDATDEQQEAMLDLRLQLGSFEGNPQSLRIVSRLAHKWLPSDGEEPEIADWFGLDLTAASLDAICKYPWTRDTEDQLKWGCYGQSDSASAPGDEPVLAWAREATGAGPILDLAARQSFEAQMMEWCDDVAYAVHDVEDFYEAGLIPLESLMYDKRVTREWELFRDGVVAKWEKRGRPKYQGEPVTADLLDWARACLMDDETARGIVSPGPFRGTNLERRLAHKRTSALIAYFLKRIDYEGQPYLHEGRFIVAPNAELQDLLVIQCDMLKEMIWTFVMNSPSLASQQAGHKRIISDLVTAMCESGGEALLPVQFRELLEDSYVRVGYQDGVLAKLRVVSDYVVSLTEQHAFALHRRVTGADPGGLRDLI